MEGRWSVTYYLAGMEGLNTSEQEIVDSIGNTEERVWDLEYQCERAPCDLTFESLAPYRSDPVSDVVEYSDGVYRFTEFGTFDCTIDATVIPDGYAYEIPFELFPRDLVETAEGWVANGLEGARTFIATPTPEAESQGCEAGTEEWLISAVRADPDAPVGYGVVTPPASPSWRTAEWQGEARVEGPWTISWTMLSPTGPEADEFAERYLADDIGYTVWGTRWSMTPRCDEGACDLDVEALETAYEEEPTSHLFTAFPDRSAFRTPIGETFSGNCTLSDGSQVTGYTVHDFFEFEVIDAVEDGDEWVATEIIGEWRQVWRGTRPGCPTADIEMFLRGVRTDLPPFAAT